MTTKNKIIEQYIEEYIKKNDLEISKEEAYKLMVLQSIDPSINIYNYESTEVDGSNDIGIDNIVIKHSN